MSKIHVHIHTEDAPDDTWLKKDIGALEASIGALGMASPHVRSQLLPAMKGMLADLKTQLKSLN